MLKQIEYTNFSLRSHDFSFELPQTSISKIKPIPRILSLDDGGIRGLSSLFILRGIMEEIRSQTKAMEIPLPCQYFDLIGGSGTGGLIAIMLGLLEMVNSIEGPY